MRHSTIPDPCPPGAKAYMWFLAAEAVCVVAFCVLLELGYETVALVFLIGPFQVLVLVLLARRGYWLLLYFAALLPMTALELLPYGYAFLVLYGGTFALLLFLRVTGSLVSQRLWPGKLGLATSVPMMIFAASVVLAGAFAAVRGWCSEPLLRHSLLALEALLAVWFFALIPGSLRQVRMLVYMLAAGYVVVCGVLPFLATRVVSGFMTKTLMTPNGAVNLNVFAAHVGALAVVLVGTILDVRKTLVKLFLAAAVAVLLAALLFSKSRGAWLGVGFAFLYVVVRARSFGLLLLTAAVAAGLYSSSVLRVGVSARVEATTAQDPSLWGRLVLWKYAWIVFKDNWVFGVGMQNFRFVKHLYGFPLPKLVAWVYNAHNLFLEVLVDLGVVGFVSFVCLKAGVFFRLDKVGRKPAATGRGLALGLNAGIVVYAVHGLFDCVIWQHGAFMLLGVLLGLAISVHRLTSLMPESETRCR